MKIFILITSLISQLASANQLPPWIEKTSRLQAFEQLSVWSTQTKSFSIGEITSKEVESADGVLTQEIEIKLEAPNCKAQKLATSCLPVGLHTNKPSLFCNSQMIDCAGAKLSKVELVK